MGATETILIPPYGHTLAGTLREILANTIASRIELKPQSLWTNGEFDSSDLSQLTQTNASAADTIDANTTVKGHLYINNNATNAQRPNTAPWVNLGASGDFNVYTRIQFSGFKEYHHAWIGQYTDSSNFAYVYLYWSSAGGGVLIADMFLEGVSETPLTIAANTMLIAGPLLLRLERVSNTFTGYYSTNHGLTWITIGSGTDAGITSGSPLGIGSSSFNTLNVLASAFDFFRNWPPYVTTSPVSTLVLDSGAAGTTWTPSTFVALENPYATDGGVVATLGLGTLKYRLAAGESNPPTLSGSALTEAQVQALSPITGRYLKIEVTFISANGYELAAFAGAKIQRTINLGAARLVNGGLVG